MKIVYAAMAGFLLAFIMGCGSTGAPQPPSLDLPQPVKDLRATRKADKVTLTWTQPKLTTDEETARHLGPTHVCRGVAEKSDANLKICSLKVGDVPPQPLGKDSAATPGATFTEVVPGELQNSNRTGFAGYAVEVTNQRGRSAGLSNQVSVPLAPTSPPATGVRAEVRADGVYLSAAGPPTIPDKPGLQFAFRAYRHQVPLGVKEAPVVVAEFPAAATLEAVDRNFEWEKEYAYTFTPVTKVLGAAAGSPSAEVEGEDSAPIEVLAHDVFPPAAPTAVQAVYSGSPQQNFIDIIWAPNAENDLAGYYVYRHEAGAAAVKVSGELLKSPAFRDGQVSAGHTYFYSISAVDLRNNESMRSAETSESVPQRP